MTNEEKLARATADEWEFVGNEHYLLCILRNEVRRLRSENETLRTSLVERVNQVSDQHFEICGLNTELASAQRGHAALAEQLQAKHPADSELPISEEWIRAVGFDWFYARLRLHFSSGIYVATLSPWLATWELGGKTIPPLNTRGDVRRLCRALGIELKEKP
jgi:hypothetical protein